MHLFMIHALKVLHSVQREEHTKKDVSTNGSGNNMLDDGEYGHWYKISPVQRLVSRELTFSGQKSL